jgi:hypothetical protein
MLTDGFRQHMLTGGRRGSARPDRFPETFMQLIKTGRPSGDPASPGGTPNDSGATTAAQCPADVRQGPGFLHIRRDRRAAGGAHGGSHDTPAKKSATITGDR